MKVNTLNFRDYFRAIVNLNPGTIKKENIKDYLKIYYHCQKGFNDIKLLFASALTVVENHHENLQYSRYKLIKSYLKAYIDNRESNLSLYYILGELNLAAHCLQEEINYSELETLVETQNILYQLESTYHDMNMILQEVGYLFLDELEDLVKQLSPINRDIVFTALKNNMEKKAVQQYYHNYKIKNRTTVFRDIINV